MPAFLAAVVAVAGISFAAAFLLETQQRTADSAYTTSGARVDLDPRLSGGDVKKH